MIADWFTQMALKYCGKDYGSPKLNQYFFYRVVYHMTASEAWERVQ